MVEEWKIIEGYEDYQISNWGRVKSFKNLYQEKILKPKINSDGYLFVRLYKDGKPKQKLIHRLVCEEFSDIPKLEVNHLNGDKSDNRIENLEWCTRAENERYSWKTLNKKAHCKGGNKKGTASLGKPIIQYDLNDNYIKRWKSASEAGRALNIRTNKISACCRKERNKTGGYKWRFDIR